MTRHSPVAVSGVTGGQQIASTTGTLRRDVITCESHRRNDGCRDDERGSESVLCSALFLLACSSSSHLPMSTSAGEDRAKFIHTKSCVATTARIWPSDADRRIMTLSRRRDRATPYGGWCPISSMEKDHSMASGFLGV